MKCPKCNFEQPDQNLECMRCGIIFEKFRSRRQTPPQPSPIPFEPEADDEGSPGFTKDLLFYVNPQINPLIFWGRALFFLVILIWGIQIYFHAHAIPLCIQVFLAPGRSSLPRIRPYYL